MPQTDWILYQKTLDFLRLRKRAYQLTFQDPKNNEALKDLAKFCHIGKAPYHPDQRLTDILIGRQEVFYRIIDHLKLQPDELLELYSKPSSLQQPTQE
jgi:hypothetical protein